MGPFKKYEVYSDSFDVNREENVVATKEKLKLWKQYIWNWIHYLVPKGESNRRLFGADL